MWRNYSLVSLRVIARNKLYSFVTVAGFAIGLSACTVLLIFVQDQRSYDTWIPNGDRIFRLELTVDMPGRAPLHVAQTPGPALPALREAFPEIESAVRLVEYETIAKRGDVVAAQRMLMVDQGFFDVFDLGLVRGDKAALRDPSSLFLSEAEAERWFGRGADPLGQALTVTISGKDYDMQVAGVLRDLPSNTHLSIGIVMPLLPNRPDDGRLLEWGEILAFSYLKLKQGTSADALAAALPDFAHRAIPDASSGGQTLHMAEMLKLSLINIRKIQLHSTASHSLKPVGDIRTVYALSAVAFLILAIAAVNFTNLSTARAGQRAREVAMRKVLGATRLDLAVQFLGESMLVAMLALLAALACVELALPVLNSLFGTKLAIHDSSRDSVLPLVAVLTAMAGLIGGMYPALHLSRFEPAPILKANSSTTVDGSVRLRGTLVTLQFAISTALIIVTSVGYAQTRFVQTADKGFLGRDLLVLRSIDRARVAAVADALASELRKEVGVVGVARASAMPGHSFEANVPVRVPGETGTRPTLLRRWAVDESFFDVYGIPVVAGRALSARYSEDDARGMNTEGKTPTKSQINIVLNQSALRRLGLGDAGAAIGKQLHLSLNRMVDATIVGVVANFQFESARSEIPPTVFLLDRDDYRALTVRFDRRSSETVTKQVEQVWRRLVPEVPLDAALVENLVAAQYEADEMRALVLGVCALLAISVACLGLYGMASFSVERRRKEIGIRKVMGAGVWDILRLLLMQFSRPVLAANLIAWPVGWWLARDWLNGFVLRIPLSPLWFLGASAVALVIAWATVAGQAYRVARSSPTLALRCE